MKIKVAELFYSVQGEGRYMGVPSIFLRTFGCNFKCAGFGMPRGQRSTEAEFVDPKQFRLYQELPLVSTGCDSYASWDPRFKDLSAMMTTDEIAQQIIRLLPYRAWRSEHLVITGGEPLLGWQRAYPELLDHPLMVNLREVTFETNGTQPLSDDFKRYLLEKFGGNRDCLTFSVSPKLSVSGESWSEAIQPEVVASYNSLGYTYLKFVVATEDDVSEAIQATSEYRTAGFTGPVYLMPVGGVEQVYSMNNRQVAELAMTYGLRYSDRLQVPLFKNAWGT